MVCVRSSYFLSFPFLVWEQDRSVKLVYSMSWHWTCANFVGVLIFLPWLSFRYYTGRWANSPQSVFPTSLPFSFFASCFLCFWYLAGQILNLNEPPYVSIVTGLGRRNSFVYLFSVYWTVAVGVPLFIVFHCKRYANHTNITIDYLPNIKRIV
jgi:hypothetical protein